jgi:hypothetical protein
MVAMHAKFSQLWKHPENLGRKSGCASLCNRYNVGLYGASRGYDLIHRRYVPTRVESNVIFDFNKAECSTALAQHRMPAAMSW